MREAIIIVRSGVSYSHGVRSFAERFFSAEKVSALWSKRLVLVLDELYMNAVTYGVGGENGEARVTFQAFDDKLVFSVQDNGTGKSHIAASELQKLVQKKISEMDHKKTSGRGLSLIASQWTDDVVAEDIPTGGIRISCTKLRHNIGIDAAEKPDALPEVMPDVPELKNFVSQVVSFRGQVGEDNLQTVVEPVTRMINNGKPLYLILDFAQLEYFNSMFIGALANWNQKVQNNGGRLVIASPSPSAREILALVGLSDILPMYNSTEEALAAVKKPQNA